MMGIAWVVPQGIELEYNPYSPYASGAFWLYVTGCFLFIFWGFRAGRKAKQRRIARSPEQELQSFSMRRLLIAAVGLTALGQIAVFQMRGIDISGMGGQWTGIITMWALLSKANGFGLCLAVLVFVRTRSLAALAVAVVAAAPIVHASFLGVRREAIFDLVILTAGAWYLSKRSYPPRAAVIVCLLVGTVILNTAGEIRGQVRPGESTLLSVLTSSETYRGFDFFNLDQGAASEVGLARYDFWYVNHTWRWEFGADYWNRLVHQYVPAFLLGRDFKEGLKISTLSERLRRGDADGAFSLGSTRTGFSDSYRSFAVFGLLVFGAIGYGFGVLHAIATSGVIAGQYLYLVLMAEGLKAITHSTSEFFSTLPFTLILSLLVLRYARSQARAASFDQPVGESRGI
ncbi:MAG: hypothetical protein NXH88_09015 [Hyphomonas sp.]|nr:hypothetical protein [Hyphomonas sp.]